MGLPIGQGNSNETPQQKVTLTRHLAVWKHEVTTQEFTDLMGYQTALSTSCQGKCPVHSVSWHEAAAYGNALSAKLGLPECYDCTGKEEKTACQVKKVYAGSKYYECLGYRLPTEAEWEYMARAGSTEPTYDTLNDIAWYQDNANNTQHPVEEKKANAWGLFDTLGNVAEWVYDSAYRGYSPQPVTDPVQDTDGNRVIRGGHWDSGKELRVSQRQAFSPGTKTNTVGFRVCRTLPFE